MPGYDRHFTMLASYGIEMVTVPMLDDGPDVAAVEALVKDDPSVKGIWIVPTYANPAGSVVTQEVASRLASMPTAAPDFRIFWDNAYAFHHLTEDEAKSADILSLVVGGGAPAPAGHVRLDEQDHVCRRRASRSSPRRARRSPGTSGTSSSRRSARTRSTSCATCSCSARRRACATTWSSTARSSRRSSPPSTRALTEGLAGLGVAEWTRPAGGYFVSLDVLDGCAARVVALAKEAGIALTPAGASFPHGRDPRDRNIRLAPSFPELAEVETAMAGVATCVALATAERLADIG